MKTIEEICELAENGCCTPNNETFKRYILQLLCDITTNIGEGMGSQQLPIVSEINSSDTAILNTFIPVDVSAGVVTVTIPAGAIPGDRVIIVDSRFNALANNITVDLTTNAYNLYAVSQDYTLDINGGQVTFTFVDSTIGWVVEV